MGQGAGQAMIAVIRLCSCTLQKIPSGLASSDECVSKFQLEFGDTLDSDLQVNALHAFCGYRGLILAKINAVVFNERTQTTKDS